MTTKTLAEQVAELRQQLKNVTATCDAHRAEQTRMREQAEAQCDALARKLEKANALLAKL